MNAHINYDLPQALVAVITAEQFDDPELVRRYASRTGRDVSAIHFYEAFALFKVAVVIQQIYFRYQLGQTHDARFADFGGRAIGLLRAAWDVAAK